MPYTSPCPHISCVHAGRPHKCAAMGWITHGAPCRGKSLTFHYSPRAAPAGELQPRELFALVAKTPGLHPSSPDPAGTHLLEHAVQGLRAADVKADEHRVRVRVRQGPHVVVVG